MLDLDEMNELIIKVLQEEEQTENCTRVINNIIKCDYIPFLIRYKSIVLQQEFNQENTHKLLNMIDTQIQYITSKNQLKYLKSISRTLYSIDIDQK